MLLGRGVSVAYRYLGSGARVPAISGATSCDLARWRLLPQRARVISHPRQPSTSTFDIYMSIPP